MTGFLENSVRELAKTTFGLEGGGGGGGGVLKDTTYLRTLPTKFLLAFKF